MKRKLTVRKVWFISMAILVVLFALGDTHSVSEFPVNLFKALAIIPFFAILFRVCVWIYNLVTLAEYKQPKYKNEEN